MKHLLRTGIAQLDAVELTEQDNGITMDAKRMVELGRRPDMALPRRLVHKQAVIGLASTVVITWQNMLFLAAIALSTGGLAGFFWTSLGVFAAMHVVYIGFGEKAERWPVAAGQYFWVAQLAARR
ncbi:choline transporter, partial [Elasticomyces elasticus]